MPKYQITDQNTGKKYVITAPDQASGAAAAKQYFSKPAEVHPPAEFLGEHGLPIPGRGDAPTGVTPSRTFGLGRSDTLNPLPAIASMGEGMASKIPVLGPHLQSWRDQVNANVYGGTPEEARADINQTVKANPEANVAGQVLGATLPYAAAGEVPVLAQTLGFAGPWVQRGAMTLASQFAINTGDNRAHGDDPMTAATKGLVDATAALPWTILGKRPKATGPQADAVKVMQREGVPLTAGQMKGSKPLMTMESQLGGGATAAFQDKQLSALTRAALKRAGVSAGDASVPVLQEAYDKIGNRFNTLAAMTKVRLDSTLQNDVIKAATDYQALVGQPAPIVEQFINRIGQIAQQNGGVLKGDNYKVLITDLIKATKGSSSIEVQAALKDIRNAVDDAVERSMGGQTREAWRTVRQQYKNLIHVTDAVAGAGASAAKGLITPASLRAAVSSGDKRNYAKGVGDLNELSHAANITMVPIPDSGTAGRLASIASMGAIPAAGAALASGNLGHAAALAGGLALPSLAGRAMLSGPGRALLGGNGTTLPAAAARGLIPQANLLGLIGTGGG